MYIRLFILLIIYFPNNIYASNVKSNIKYYLALQQNYIFSDQQERTNHNRINYARITYSKSDLKLPLKSKSALKLQLDFGNKKEEVKELFIEFGKYKHKLKIGQFKIPNSFLIPSELKNQAFVAKPAISKILLDRKLGINYKLKHNNFLVSVALNSQNINKKLELDNFNSKLIRLAYNIKITQKKANILHLATSYQKINTDYVSYKINEVNYSQKHKADLITNKISKLENSSYHIFEAALVNPKSILIYEYVRNKLASKAKREINFYGYYFIYRYNLIGQNFIYDQENKSYNIKKAPNHLDIAFRLSVLNLDDREYSYGKYQSNAISVNYQLTKKVKLIANYHKIKTNKNSYAPYNSPEILSIATELSF